MQDFSEEPTDEMHRTLGGNLGVTRRGFMRATAAAGGAAAVGVGGNQLGLQPIGEADAIAPAVLVAAAGAGFAADWLLREYEVFGADDPPEGMTASVLKNRIYEGATKTKSRNASTFIDNQNIVSGITHVAYADAKLAAIEKLNEGVSESEFLSAGNDAIDAVETNIKTNFLRSWNESVQELYNWKQAVENHPDVSVGSVFTVGDGRRLGEMTTSTRTLADGTEFELKSYGNLDDSGTNTPINPYGGFVTGGVKITASSNLTYMVRYEWETIRNEIENAFEEVRNGFSTWATTVYSEVQAGELDPAELMSPRELAEVTSDDETFPQAIHDLMALNVAVDLEREAEVHFPNTDTTVYGSLAVDGDTSVTTGTVDPSADEFTYYLTYDVSQGEGEWTDYQTGIDGGTITFTAEPHQETVYRVHTNAGEQVDVAAADLTDQEDGTWTVDVSADLETAVAEIDSVNFYADVDGTQFETIRLDQTFEVVSFTDSEGNEHEEADFTRTETQNDTNYITEDEWRSMMEKQQALIDKYEEAQNSGGGGGWFDFGGSSSAVGILAVAAAAIGAILLGNNN